MLKNINNTDKVVEKKRKNSFMRPMSVKKWITNTCRQWKISSEIFNCLPLSATRKSIARNLPKCFEFRKKSTINQQVRPVYAYCYKYSLGIIEVHNRLLVNTRQVVIVIGVRCMQLLLLHFCRIREWNKRVSKSKNVKTPVSNQSPVVTTWTRFWVWFFENVLGTVTYDTSVENSTHIADNERYW